MLEDYLNKGISTILSTFVCVKAGLPAARQTADLNVLVLKSWVVLPPPLTGFTIAGRPSV